MLVVGHSGALVLGQSWGFGVGSQLWTLVLGMYYGCWVTVVGFGVGSQSVGLWC